MAKVIARHDRISIDGTDVSNLFNEFGFASEDSEVDVSGFSETGNDETLPGSRAQGFEGQAFYTEELAAIVNPIHFNREVVEIQWQPNGLVDPTATVYYADCNISRVSPKSTRGQAAVQPFSAKTATATGIQYAAGT